MKNDGKALEKLVHIIEKSISPDSIVKLDVNLPVLTSRNNRTRQCDIVIYQGPKGRENISIVEVQDRNSQVSIGDFCNWLEKLREVGANHLICVSRKDYPDSVKEKATEEGQRVFLINIKDSTPEDLPLGFINFKFIYRNLTISAYDHHKVYVKPGEIERLNLQPHETSLEDKIWQTNSGESTSLLEEIKKRISSKIEEKSIEEEVSEGETCFSVEDGSQISLSYENSIGKTEAAFEGKAKWVYENYLREMKVVSYEQIDTSPSVWVFEHEQLTYDGPVKIKIPVERMEDGQYRLLDQVIESSFPSLATVLDADGRPI